MFTKDLEELKNKQTEMNNTLERISSTITEAEEQINDLEVRMVEITATEQNTEKRMKRDQDSLRDLWNNIKHNKICIFRGPRRRREKGPEKILEEIILKTSLTWDRK